MARMKTFFIYFMLVVLMFIFSQVMIYIALNTTYKYKEVEINTTMPMELTVEATSINGKANGKIVNNGEEVIENKYVKIDFYSKNNVLMGTKYIEIDKVNAKDEKEFEVHFNFNKVEKAIVSVIDEKELEENNIQEEEKVSDPERGLAAMTAALILLYFI